MPNVFTNRLLAGSLDRVDSKARFTYDSSTTAQSVVSLTMPPAPNAVSLMDEPNIVHPIFAMNLPEGRLRESLLGMFSKTIPDMDDMTLIEIVGRSQIGRLRMAPSADELDNVPSLSLNELLKTQGTEKMLDGLLARYARHSGVAGVQPKVLVRDSNSLEDSPLKKSLNKVTASGTTHIVKFFEPDKYPALAANEYACLRAAKLAGLPVPAFWLSADSQCLVVERFDLKPDGTYLAVEDCCALAGYQPGQKYVGSYEQIAKALFSAIAPEHIPEDLGVFFRSLVLSTVVRNGDAHRKNFSVIYSDSSDVRLSPIYDIISTTPYIPNDNLALTLNGSKRWPSPKKLIRFGVNICELSHAEVRDSIDQVCAAVAKAREDAHRLREEASDERSAKALTAMLAAWEDGLRCTDGRSGVCLL